MRNSLPSTPSGSPDSKKQYKSMLKWSGRLEYDLYGSNGYDEAMDVLREYKLIDAETYKLAQVYFEREKAGYNVDINGGQLDIPELGQGISSCQKALGYWFHQLRTQDLSDPKSALKIVKQNWKDVVQPVRARMKGMVKISLKKQAYFSAKGLRQIRARILRELKKEYPGFMGGHNPSGVRTSAVVLEQLEKKLNTDVKDLFNINSLTAGFLSSLPSLVNNKLDLEKVFNHDDVQSRYKELVEKFGKYLEKFGEKVKRERNEVSEGIDLTDGEIEGVAMTEEEFEKMWSDSISRTAAKDLYDAEQNLVNFGFTLENGKIIDEDGNELPGVTTNYRKAIVQLSEMIDEKGYDKTMGVVKNFGRHVAEGRSNLEEKYGWSFDDDAGVIYDENGKELDLEGHGYDEAIAEFSSRIKEHGYEEFMREWEAAREERRRKGRG